MTHSPPGFPKKQGLYDPALEKDACGVGFVVNIKGRKSHEIVEQGLEALVNLTHRGATGADPDVGDGAGILLQLPDAFFREVCGSLGFDLPEAPGYGVGMVFLPSDEAQRAVCESIINDRIVQEGQKLLGWRTVPVQSASLGKISREWMPYIRQVFVAAGADAPDQAALDRKLYVIRRLIEKAVMEAGV
ncbi:MAG: glutamate synthase subunit alpha, partial [SAR324 cluster bacterium]|nr:glutamate synthase subunit alpha [SAR324 cluster bacterium]